MSGADNTASARPAQEGKIYLPNTKRGDANRRIKAFCVRDGDSGAVIVFDTSPAAARRRGANDLDTDFESVESCRRAPEFDAFAERGFVPCEELIAAGWRFECYGCGNQVDRDLEDEDEDGEPVPLNPVYEPHGVWCTPECKARDAEDKRIRKEIQDAAIEDFKRRVLKRFPGANFEGGDIFKEHAYAGQHGALYGLEKIVVSFSFPGQKIGTATLRYDLVSGLRSEKLYGPWPPEFFCCNGDREAFEAYARETAKSGSEVRS